MSDEATMMPPRGPLPKRIGKYRILRQLAQGGMAEIFLASASGIEGFEKLVVLKRILPLLAANAEFVEMFLDEARIAASLLHSNIAQVFDIGSDQGSYYFVMEFLRGEDVRHILQRSAGSGSFIPHEHVVTVLTGVCSGLHYAHEMRGKDGKPLQMVHRDISPQNVFVTHDGNVKLCDFGIAKSAARLTETRVGTLKGKIRYMSPEQCQAEPLDRRSDIFSLCIMLWEMVALRRLYSGRSDFEIFKAIVEEPAPKPSEFRRDVPAGLEAIIMKGLQHRREDRFQTAQELQIALEDWARHDRVPASPVRLAGFMTQLFGPPATTVESFLEKASESDPLALRIKAHNDNETSDPSFVEARTTLGHLQAGEKADSDATEAGSAPFGAEEGASSTADGLASSRFALPRNGPRPWMIIGSAALVGVAWWTLLLTRKPTPAVVPRPAVVAAPLAPAVAPPVVPVFVPPPVAVPAVEDPAPVVQQGSHATLVRRAKRAPAKKTLDDLLPP